MRIPLEHFSAMPVFALSPSSSNDPASDKKLSSPPGLCLLDNSVGSAPNSPAGQRRKLSNVSTISGGNSAGPMSLQPAAGNGRQGGKYATLPNK